MDDTLAIKGIEEKVHLAGVFRYKIVPLQTE